MRRQSTLIIYITILFCACQKSLKIGKSTKDQPKIEFTEIAELPYVSNDNVHLKFLNRDVGFFVGGGVLYRTDNGGLVWKEIKGIHTQMGVQPPVFLNDSLGYFIAYGLYRTTDRGINWSLVKDSIQGYSYNLSQAAFSGKNGIICCKENNALFVSSDSGYSWKMIHNSNFGGVSFYLIDNPNFSWPDPDHLFIGQHNNFFESNDKGYTWKLKKHNENILGNIQMFDSKRGYVLMEAEGIGQPVDIWSTDDGGQTWKYNCHGRSSHGKPNMDEIAILPNGTCIAGAERVVCDFGKFGNWVNLRNHCLRNPYSSDTIYSNFTMAGDQLYSIRITNDESRYHPPYVKRTLMKAKLNF